MIYVIDTNSLSNVLNHYYPNRFPSFWEKFNNLIQYGRLISVREAKFELERKFDDDVIAKFEKLNHDFFITPSAEELGFITQIYSIPHFRQNLDRKKLLQGGYFADPFIIAKAWKLKGTVVTEEDFKEHAAKIPNICDHFHIACEKLEGFLTKEDWKF